MEDEELNLFSRRFSAKKFITAKSLPPSILPRDQIPPAIIEAQKRALFDNFAAFDAAYRAAGASISAKVLVPNVRQPTAGKTAEPDATSARRFLPHQQLVSRPRPARLTRNLLIALESTSSESPILQFLKSCRDTRQRVQIDTRTQKGVRGSICGFVEAYDKHWNVALSEVKEVWHRRKFNYSENKVASGGVKVSREAAQKKLAAMGIQVPEVAVQSIDRKKVKCTRYVKQLLVRGEQIVLVMKEPESEE